MTARKPEPLCPYRHFIDEDTRNPRGRVRSTLKILEDRERGENEVQMCSNGRMEEMCYAVIEASDLLDAARASLAAAERERDEARLKANILADGAFHDGKELSRLTDWTTELRGQVSAQRALTGSACGTKKPNAPCTGCYSTPCVCDRLEDKP